MYMVKGLGMDFDRQRAFLSAGMILINTRVMIMI